MKKLLLGLLLVTSCAQTDKRTISNFEEYKVSKNQYRGSKSGSDSYHDVVWIVDGTGRVIDAKIFVGDKIAKQKLWHYDSLLNWRRQSNHKRMMLEALQWAN